MTTSSYIPSEEEQQVNWIHPELLEWVKELVPNDINQINPYTCDIFNARFIVAGENVNIAQMLGFLMDNGWENEAETEQDQS